MKNMIITTLCALALATNLATAAPVDEGRAAALATRFFQNNLPQTRAENINIALAWTDTSDATRQAASEEENTLYIYALNGTEGFIILSADDRAYPVLGYSFDHAFDPESIAPNMLEWLRGYRAQISFARENSATPSAETSAAWAALEQGLSYANTRVTALETALWDQVAPFNNNCPSIGAKRAPTGCVATAMAIIMKYHRWPDVGEGSSSYKDTGRNQTLSATYNTTYDWDNMPLSYSTYTSTQGSAVAKLMSDCGIAAEMQYSASSSGAYTYVAIKGMVTHFKYDKSVEIHDREWYGTAQWNQLMKNEIDNYRPIFYSGTTAREEGHQFVIDGYNDYDYFHVNWGWSGLGNAYYVLSALTPSAQGTGGGTGGFNYNQQAAIKLMQAHTGSDYIERIGLMTGFSTDNTYFSGLEATETTLTAGKDFRVKTGFITNFGLADFNGVVALMLTDGDGNRKSFASTAPVKVKNLNYYAGTGSTGLTCQIPTGTTIGTDDRLRLFYYTLASSAAVDAYNSTLKYNDAGWKLVEGYGDAIWELKMSVLTTISLLEAKADNIQLLTSDGEITLISPDSIERVQIYTANGQKVGERIIGGTANQAVINTTDYAQGVYIVLITTAHQVISKKFTR